ncbi:MAG: hypothetical protein JHC95_00755 [Solirubrobacteraceae bacterium]|nr:hypothetical protein [Solirubrobacteraceae bacterium]
MEIASGLPLGTRGAPTFDGASTDAASALRTAVRDAVHHPPCLVSFSGGQDSSLVLAAAVQVARRDGVADPIPATWRVADAPAAHESDWQDAVVRELGLGDWLRLDGGDDLDLLGPVARSVLSRHGARYPANVHMHDPLLERARGGSLLTGIGGDQIFGAWRWAAVADVLAGRVRRTPRRLLAIARSRAPVPVRAALEPRRNPPEPRDWLTPKTAQTLSARLAEEIASEPPRWDRRVGWQAGRRHLALGLESLDLLAADHDVRIGHPLVAPGVVAAVARAGGRDGFASRRQALATLFPGLTPDALRERTTKAHFHEVFHRGPSRRAIAAWRGDGVDPTVVDVPALQAIWRDRMPAGTALLLQHLFVRGALGG